MRTIALAMMTGLSALMATSARAESVDASTITCETLAKGVERKDTKFVNGLLNWMGGYHATEAQGTIVDFKLLSAAFDKTTEFCALHPRIGVMSASEKFMGEHIEEATPDAIDVAIVKCGDILQTKDKNIGDTFMWLDGYHTSLKKEASTMLDFDKFVVNIDKIVDYCVAHKDVGLFTVSEKYMGEEK